MSAQSTSTPSRPHPRGGRLLAVAATATLAAGLTTGPVPAAIAKETVASRCLGSEVQRCVALETYRDTMRAEAAILDRRGRTNYQVAVSYLTYQEWNGQSWVVLRSRPDLDGWDGVSDVAATATRACARNRKYRAVATVKWRSVRSDGSLGPVTKRRQSSGELSGCPR